MGTQSARKHNWFVLSSLVGKDFKLKYRRSVLGIAWSVLNPLLMMAVLTAVFSAFFRFSIEYYPVYLILGQTLFSFMSDATSGAMGSIVGSSSLIKKIRIDKVIFPVEKVMFALVNFAVSLIAVCIVFLFFQIPLTVYAFLLPVLLLLVFLFSLGIGLILSSLAVFFRDVFHLWSVVLTAWTYFTPIFYPIDILPEWVMSFMNWNPMYYFVNFFRDILLYGCLPPLREIAICTAFAVIAFLVGYIVFRKTQRRFILYV